MDEMDRINAVLRQVAALVAVLERVGMSDARTPVTGFAWSPGDPIVADPALTLLRTDLATALTALYHVHSEMGVLLCDACGERCDALDVCRDCESRHRVVCAGCGMSAESHVDGGHR